MDNQPVRYERVFHAITDDIDHLGHVNNKHPARPGDEVIARTWVGPPSAATFERHTEILRAGDQRVLARARSLWCPVHPGTGRLRRIDPALHDRFYAR